MDEWMLYLVHVCGDPHVAVAHGPSLFWLCMIFRINSIFQTALLGKSTVLKQQKLLLAFVYQTMPRLTFAQKTYRLIPLEDHNKIETIPLQPYLAIFMIDPFGPSSTVEGKLLQ